MCPNLFHYLPATRGPQQKTIIFCARGLLIETKTRMLAASPKRVRRV
jgi:hypothetical protein